MQARLTIEMTGRRLGYWDKRKDEPTKIRIPAGSTVEIIEHGQIMTASYRGYVFNCNHNQISPV